MDFYCAARRLAVEVDGASHGLGDLGYDERRDADLALRGARVVRFAATEVLGILDGVVRSIEAALGG